MSTWKQGHINSPPHEILRLGAKRLVGRELQKVTPVHNLPIHILVVLTAEGWPTNQTFEHDRANGPPIACIVVSVAREYLGRNVVGRADGGIGKLSTRLAPSVDLAPVADCQLNLIKGHRLTVIPSALWLAVNELLIVGLVMLLVETSRQSKVGKLDVSPTIKQDVIGFDVATCVRTEIERLRVRLTDG